ncbi:MAG: hypothetical protein ACPG49_08735 [Chitinophagales bacterium]
MKTNFLILIAFFLVIIASCEPDSPEPDIPKPINPTQTNFKIDANSFISSQTNLYVTDFGKIVETYGEGFQLFMILSDASGTSFEVTDTLKGVDNNSARIVLKIADDYHFSTTGTIVLDADNEASTMEISFDEINLTGGELYIDSVITEPILDFTNITMTDIFGVPMNDGDENDWIIRSDFEVIERLIFNENSESFLERDLEISSYPNPFNKEIRMLTDFDENDRMDLFLVNENFEIETKIIQLPPLDVYAFRFDNLKEDTYYRLYYRVYSENETYYGSGDLKVD